MFLRITDSNLTIERAVSTSAQRDSEGNIAVHPVQTTEYVGGVHAGTTYANVPAGLLAKLDDAEKEELKEALKDNEPRPDQYLSDLHRYICRAFIEMRQCATLATGPEVRRILGNEIKLADVAWAAFNKTARDVGLKPTRSRAAKKGQ